jgi:hypothetical protein
MRFGSSPCFEVWFFTLFDIGGIVDPHCLNFLFIIVHIADYLPISNKVKNQTSKQGEEPNLKSIGTKKNPRHMVLKSCP